MIHAIKKIKKVFFVGLLLGLGGLSQKAQADTIYLDKIDGIISNGSVIKDQSMYGQIIVTFSSTTTEASVYFGNGVIMIKDSYASTASTMSVVEISTFAFNLKAPSSLIHKRVKKGSGIKDTFTGNSIRVRIGQISEWVFGSFLCTHIDGDTVYGTLTFTRPAFLNHPVTTYTLSLSSKNPQP